MSEAIAKIILACSKKPLAAFIETEMAGDMVDCRVAVDGVQLKGLVAEFEPDVLLLESEFPTSDESSALLGELRDSNPQIPMVGIFEPFGETQDRTTQGLAPEDVLSLPFSGDDLREKLSQACGLEIKKRTVPPEEKEEKEMDNPQVFSVETLELTEIIEEGLPLDELPEISDGKTSDALLNVDPGEALASSLELESEPEDNLELDGFGDNLDDLESAFEESADVGSDSVVEDVEVVQESESEIESEVEENSSELVAGDIDALLADDDFTEVEIPEKTENHDPVLAELKSAGLTPEDEVVAVSDSEAASTVAPEFEEDGFVGAGDDFSDEILVEEDAVVESEDSEQLLTSTESSEPQEKSEEIFAAESPEADIELPEDYLLDEEVSAHSIESAARPLDSSPTLSSEPEVCTEPISPDFSRQIEDMTQEWSKQLLQTTYASMDKMIKAIGDLAPTIVDQVAREVIPSLAEKVIKAEIARLEEKLELEEESDSEE